MNKIYYINSWGFIKHCQIQFQNPFSNIIKKYRIRKACKLWNEDLDQITYLIRVSKKENADFYWNQLVLQEIFMYCRLGEQVEKKEFDDLCKTRGFDDNMISYLKFIIKEVGLGKKL